MITTLDDITAQFKTGNGFALSGRSSYPMSAGDFFAVCADSRSFREHALLEAIDIAAERCMTGGRYAAVREEYRELKMLRDAADGKELARLRGLVKEKKLELAELEGDCIHKARAEVTGSPEPPWFLTYKNTLTVTDFDNVCHFLPQLRNFRGDWIRNIPLFTRNIGRIGAAGGDLAIEGGPCMFGTGEMSVDVRMLTGELRSFDYNTVFCALRTPAQAELALEGVEPGSIAFTPRKPGITSQEFEYLDCLFQFAHLLNVPLLVTIPDFSYMKFFDNMTVHWDVDVRALLSERHRQAIYEITDLYLNFVEAFAARYPPRVLEVLHARNEGLCGLFHERREEYLRGGSITSNELKRDSVQDYISMPATPFYLWGVRNIIEINSTDETDSIRKCMKNHKNEVAFYPVMIPEKVSADGVTTVFESGPEQKDYILPGALRFSD